MAFNDRLPDNEILMTEYDGWQMKVRVAISWTGTK